MNENGQSHENHPPKKHNLVLRWVVTIAVLIIMLSACFMAGYGLTLLIYMLTGTPPEYVAHAISGIFGLGIFIGVMKIAADIHKKIGKHGNRFDGLNKSIEALNRIAQGDFSVSLPVERQNHYSEFTITINNMAKNLGTMETLRQNFVSDVSHEMQSPLTSIGGFAALLKDDKIDKKQREHYIEVIETEVQRLSKLCENLLKLSTLESGAEALSVEAFALDKQIRNAVLMLEPQWTTKNISIELELSKISVTGDKDLLSQVWINIINNAIKFTPDGGRIDITLNSEPDKAVCHIRDNGVGISKDDQLRIFERFYKADKSRDRALGGSGLGLSLVKKIVDLHGGAVSVESEQGKGSVFTVVLPNK